ncbi:MAG: CHAD domain-containing protein [Anaerolineae bacterium]|jgi:CHAD domain-containing protein|nr:CHAD domain-containing protein [Anaerolineae bacterium]
MTEEELLHQEMSQQENGTTAMRQFLAWRVAVHMRPFAKQIGKAAAGKSGKKMIHKLRVSCRKFRVLLKNFRDYFPQDQVGLLADEIKKLASAFAVSREMVLLRKEIKSTRKENYTEKATMGFEVLANTCVQEDHHRKGALQMAARSFAESDNLSLLDEYVTEHHDLDNLAAVCQNTSIQSFAQDNLTRQLRKIASEAKALEHETPDDDFHQLRISLKNLHYSLKDFACLEEDHYDAQLGRIKQLQNLMGRIHDRQVWLAQINEILAVIGERNQDDEELMRNAAFAVEILKRKWRDQINADYADLKIIWGYLQRDHFWSSFFAGDTSE